MNQSSFSIYKFCRSFQSQYDQLDILIHNAGYFNHGAPYRESADRIELTFATNVFGPFLHQVPSALPVHCWMLL